MESLVQVVSRHSSLPGASPCHPSHHPFTQLSAAPTPHSSLHCYLVYASGIVPQTQPSLSPPDGTETQLSGSTPARSGTRLLREALLGRLCGLACGRVTHPHSACRLPGGWLPSKRF